MGDKKVMIDNLGSTFVSVADTDKEMVQLPEPMNHGMRSAYVIPLKVEVDDASFKPLSDSEIRLIIEANIDQLISFASTDRLQAITTKGNSPLHIAAGKGKLAACDLFVQSGANPTLLNFAQQTPADLALEKGHLVTAQKLSSLIASLPKPSSKNTSSSSVETSLTVNDVASDDCFYEMQASAFEIYDDLDDLTAFKAETEPEEFYKQHTVETTSGTFVALASTASVVTAEEDGDWVLDLSPVGITGEGLVSTVESDNEPDSEHDFLKVRGSGRQSIKRAKIQPGTRLSIDSKTCIKWAREILAKGRYSVDDVDSLIELCKGNGDPSELRLNIQRNLETAGFNPINPYDEDDAGLWDIAADISAEELAESIEATLSRSTILPGIQRFTMDKARDQQLLEPMIRAKQELHLGILASETAVMQILDALAAIRSGLKEPRVVSLKNIIPSLSQHPVTAEVMAAAEALESWHHNGSVLDGKQRRAAVEALETLDLSLSFYKELIESLKQKDASHCHAKHLGKLISDYETAAEVLILEHLSYARRFSARNTNSGEDLEDVFQVVFMGLQRSIKRFAPERGNRFAVYCTFWMQQTLTRWRADEGASIRIPVHRHDSLAKLDQALEIRVDRVLSDNELAAELEWTVEQVRQYRSMPREAWYPDSIDEWDALLPTLEESVYNHEITRKVVAETLDELQEREANVIRLRFGLGCYSEMTLEEIGVQYGVTRERIRQIEAKGLKCLAHPERKHLLQQKLGM